jgi:hypothetical protein
MRGWTQFAQSLYRSLDPSRISIAIEQCDLLEIDCVGKPASTSASCCGRFAKDELHERTNNVIGLQSFLSRPIFPSGFL